MIAWDLGILHRNRLYSPKSGYLEEFRPLGPGLVLELATIERCFEPGIEAHELLGTDEPYKLRFSTSERRHRVLPRISAAARCPRCATRGGGSPRAACGRRMPIGWRPTEVAAGTELPCTSKRRK